MRVKLTPLPAAVTAHAPGERQIWTLSPGRFITPCNALRTMTERIHRCGQNYAWLDNSKNYF
jgi:hypothetical protein